MGQAYRNQRRALRSWTSDPQPQARGGGRATRASHGQALSEEGPHQGPQLTSQGPARAQHSIQPPHSSGNHAHVCLWSLPALAVTSPLAGPGAHRAGHRASGHGTGAGRAQTSLQR